MHGLGECSKNRKVLFGKRQKRNIAMLGANNTHAENDDRTRSKMRLPRAMTTIVEENLNTQVRDANPNVLELLDVAGRQVVGCPSNRTSLATSPSVGSTATNSNESSTSSGSDPSATSHDIESLTFCSSRKSRSFHFTTSKQSAVDINCDPEKVHRHKRRMRRHTLLSSVLTKKSLSNSDIYTPKCCASPANLPGHSRRGNPLSSSSSICHRKREIKNQSLLSGFLRKATAQNTNDQDPRDEATREVKKHRDEGTNSPRKAKDHKCDKDEDKQKHRKKKESKNKNRERLKEEKYRNLSPVSSAEDEKPKHHTKKSSKKSDPDRKRSEDKAKTKSKSPSKNVKKGKNEETQVTNIAGLVTKLENFSSPLKHKKEIVKKGSSKEKVRNMKGKERGDKLDDNIKDIELGETYWKETKKSKKQKEDCGDVKKAKREGSLVRIKHSLMQLTGFSKLSERKRSKSKKRNKTSEKASSRSPSRGIAKGLSTFQVYTVSIKVPAASNMQQFLEQDNADMTKLCSCEPIPPKKKAQSTIPRAQLGSLEIPPYKPNEKKRESRRRHRKHHKSKEALEKVRMDIGTMPCDFQVTESNVQTPDPREAKQKMPDDAKVTPSSPSDNKWLRTHLGTNYGHSKGISSYDSHDSIKVGENNSLTSIADCSNMLIISELDSTEEKSVSYRPHNDVSKCNLVNSGGSRCLKNLVESLCAAPTFDSYPSFLREPYCYMTLNTSLNKRKIKNKGTNTELVWPSRDLEIEYYCDAITRVKPYLEHSSKSRRNLFKRPHGSKCLPARRPKLILQNDIEPDQDDTKDADKPNLKSKIPVLFNEKRILAPKNGSVDASASVDDKSEVKTSRIPRLARDKTLVSIPEINTDEVAIPKNSKRDIDDAFESRFLKEWTQSKDIINLEEEMIDLVYCDDSESFICARKKFDESKVLLSNMANTTKSDTNCDVSKLPPKKPNRKIGKKNVKCAKKVKGLPGQAKEKLAPKVSLSNELGFKEHQQPSQDEIPQKDWSVSKTSTRSSLDINALPCDELIVPEPKLMRPSLSTDINALVTQSSNTATLIVNLADLDEEHKNAFKCNSKTLLEDGLRRITSKINMEEAMRRVSSGDKQSVSLQVLVPSRHANTNTSWTNMLRYPRMKKSNYKSKLPLPIDRRRRCVKNTYTFPIEIDIPRNKLTGQAGSKVSIGKCRGIDDGAFRFAESSDYAGLYGQALKLDDSNKYKSSKNNRKFSTSGSKFKRWCSCFFHKKDSGEPASHMEVGLNSTKFVEVLDIPSNETFNLSNKKVPKRSSSLLLVSKSKSESIAPILCSLSESNISTRSSISDNIWKMGKSLIIQQVEVEDPQAENLTAHEEAVISEKTYDHSPQELDKKAAPASNRNAKGRRAVTHNTSKKRCFSSRSRKRHRRLSQKPKVVFDVPPHHIISDTQFDATRELLYSAEREMPLDITHGGRVEVTKQMHDYEAHLIKREKDSMLKNQKRGIDRELKHLNQEAEKYRDAYPDIYTPITRCDYGLTYYNFKSVLRGFMLEHDTLRIMTPCVKGHMQKAPKEIPSKDIMPVLLHVGSQTCKQDVATLVGEYIFPDIEASELERVEVDPRSREMIDLEAQDHFLFEIYPEFGMFDDDIQDEKPIEPVESMLTEASCICSKCGNVYAEADFTMTLNIQGGCQEIHVSFKDEQYKIITTSESVPKISNSRDWNEEFVRGRFLEQLYEKLRKDSEFLRQLRDVLKFPMDDLLSAASGESHSFACGFIKAAMASVLKHEDMCYFDAVKIKELEFKYKHMCVCDLLDEWSNHERLGTIIEEQESESYDATDSSRGSTTDMSSKSTTYKSSDTLHSKAQTATSSSTREQTESSKTSESLKNTKDEALDPLQKKENSKAVNTSEYQKATKDRASDPIQPIQPPKEKTPMVVDSKMHETATVNKSVQSSVPQKSVKDEALQPIEPPIEESPMLVHSKMQTSGHVVVASKQEKTVAVNTSDQSESKVTSELSSDLDTSSTVDSGPQRTTNDKSTLPAQEPSIHKTPKVVDVRSMKTSAVNTSDQSGSMKTSESSSLTPSMVDERNKKATKHKTSDPIQSEPIKKASVPFERPYIQRSPATVDLRHEKTVAVNTSQPSDSTDLRSKKAEDVKQSELLESKKTRKHQVKESSQKPTKGEVRIQVDLPTSGYNKMAEAKKSTKADYGVVELQETTFDTLICLHNWSSCTCVGEESKATSSISSKVSKSCITLFPKNGVGEKRKHRVSGRGNLDIAVGDDAFNNQDRLRKEPRQKPEKPVKYSAKSDHPYLELERFYTGKEYSPAPPKQEYSCNQLLVRHPPVLWVLAKRLITRRRPGRCRGKVCKGRQNGICIVKPERKSTHHHSRSSSRESGHSRHTRQKHSKSKEQKKESGHKCDPSCSGHHRHSDHPKDGSSSRKHQHKPRRSDSGHHRHHDNHSYYEHHPHHDKHSRHGGTSHTHRDKHPHNDNHSHHDKRGCDHCPRKRPVTSFKRKCCGKRKTRPRSATRTCADTTKSSYQFRMEFPEAHPGLASQSSASTIEGAYSEDEDFVMLEAVDSGLALRSHSEPTIQKHNSNGSTHLLKSQSNSTYNPKEKNPELRDYGCGSSLPRVDAGSSMTNKEKRRRNHRKQHPSEGLDKEFYDKDANTDTRQRIKAPRGHHQKQYPSEELGNEPDDAYGHKHTHQTTATPEPNTSRAAISCCTPNVRKSSESSEITEHLVDYKSAPSKHSQEPFTSVDNVRFLSAQAPTMSTIAEISKTKLMHERSCLTDKEYTSYQVTTQTIINQAPPMISMTVLTDEMIMLDQESSTNSFRNNEIQTLLSFNPTKSRQTWLKKMTAFRKPSKNQPSSTGILFSSFENLLPGAAQTTISLYPTLHFPYSLFGGRRQHPRVKRPRYCECRKQNTNRIKDTNRIKEILPAQKLESSAESSHISLPTTSQTKGSVGQRHDGPLVNEGSSFKKPKHSKRSKSNMDIQEQSGAHSVVTSRSATFETTDNPVRLTAHALNSVDSDASSSSDEDDTSNVEPVPFDFYQFQRFDCCKPIHVLSENDNSKPPVNTFQTVEPQEGAKPTKGNVRVITVEELSRDVEIKCIDLDACQECTQYVQTEFDIYTHENNSKSNYVLAHASAGSSIPTVQRLKTTNDPWTAYKHTQPSVKGAATTTREVEDNHHFASKNVQVTEGGVVHSTASDPRETFVTPDGHLRMARHENVHVDDHGGLRYKTKLAEAGTDSTTGARMERKKRSIVHGGKTTDTSDENITESSGVKISRHTKAKSNAGVNTYKEKVVETDPDHTSRIVKKMSIKIDTKTGREVDHFKKTVTDSEESVVIKATKVVKPSTGHLEEHYVVKHHPHHHQLGSKLLHPLTFLHHRHPELLKPASSGRMFNKSTKPPTDDSIGEANVGTTYSYHHPEKTGNLRRKDGSVQVTLVKQDTKSIQFPKSLEAQNYLSRTCEYEQPSCSSNSSKPFMPYSASQVISYSSTGTELPSTRTRAYQTGTKRKHPDEISHASSKRRRDDSSSCCNFDMDSSSRCISSHISKSSNDQHRPKVNEFCCPPEVDKKVGKSKSNKYQHDTKVNESCCPPEDDKNQVTSKSSNYHQHPKVNESCCPPEVDINQGTNSRRPEYASSMAQTSSCRYWYCCNYKRRSCCAAKTRSRCSRCSRSRCLRSKCSRSRNKPCCPSVDKQVSARSRPMESRRRDDCCVSQCCARCKKRHTKTFIFKDCCDEETKKAFATQTLKQFKEQYLECCVPTEEIKSTRGTCAPCPPCPSCGTCAPCPPCGKCAPCPPCGKCAPCPPCSSCCTCPPCGTCAHCGRHRKRICKRSCSSTNVRCYGCYKRTRKPPKFVFDEGCNADVIKDFYKMGISKFVKEYPECCWPRIVSRSSEEVVDTYYDMQHPDSHKQTDTMELYSQPTTTANMHFEYIFNDCCDDDTIEVFHKVGMIKFKQMYPECCWPQMVEIDFEPVQKSTDPMVSNDEYILKDSCGAEERELLSELGIARFVEIYPQYCRKEKLAQYESEKSAKRRVDHSSECCDMGPSQKPLTLGTPDLKDLNPTHSPYKYKFGECCDEKTKDAFFQLGENEFRKTHPESCWPRREKITGNHDPTHWQHLLEHYRRHPEALDTLPACCRDHVETLLAESKHPSQHTVTPSTEHDGSKCQSVAAPSQHSTPSRQTQATVAPHADSNYDPLPLRVDKQNIDIPLDTSPSKLLHLSKVGPSAAGKQSVLDIPLNFELGLSCACQRKQLHTGEVVRIKSDYCLCRDGNKKHPTKFKCLCKKGKGKLQQLKQQLRMDDAGKCTCKTRFSPRRKNKPNKKSLTLAAIDTNLMPETEEDSTYSLLQQIDNYFGPPKSASEPILGTFGEKDLFGIPITRDSDFNLKLKPSQPNISRDDAKIKQSNYPSASSSKPKTILKSNLPFKHSRTGLHTEQVMQIHSRIQVREDDPVTEPEASVEYGSYSDNRRRITPQDEKNIKFLETIELIDLKKKKRKNTSFKDVSPHVSKGEVIVEKERTSEETKKIEELLSSENIAEDKTRKVSGRATTADLDTPDESVTSPHPSIRVRRSMSLTSSEIDKWLMDEVPGMKPTPQSKRITGLSDMPLIVQKTFSESEPVEEYQPPPEPIIIPEPEKKPKTVAPEPPRRTVISEPEERKITVERRPPSPPVYIEEHRAPRKPRKNKTLLDWVVSMFHVPEIPHRHKRSHHKSGILTKLFWPHKLERNDCRKPVHDSHRTFACGCTQAKGKPCKCDGHIRHSCQCQRRNKGRDHVVEFSFVESTNFYAQNKQSTTELMQTSYTSIFETTRNSANYERTLDDVYNNMLEKLLNGEEDDAVSWDLGPGLSEDFMDRKPSVRDSQNRLSTIVERTEHELEYAHETASSDEAETHEDTVENIVNICKRMYDDSPCECMELQQTFGDRLPHILTNSEVNPDVREAVYNYVYPTTIKLPMPHHKDIVLERKCSRLGRLIKRVKYSLSKMKVKKPKRGNLDAIDSQDETSKPSLKSEILRVTQTPRGKTKKLQIVDNGPRDEIRIGGTSYLVRAPRCTSRGDNMNSQRTIDSDIPSLKSSEIPQQVDVGNNVDVTKSKVDAVNDLVKQNNMDHILKLKDEINWINQQITGKYHDSALRLLLDASIQVKEQLQEALCSQLKTNSTSKLIKPENSVKIVAVNSEQIYNKSPMQQPQTPNLHIDNCDNCFSIQSRRPNANQLHGEQSDESTEDDLIEFRESIRRERERIRREDMLRRKQAVSEAMKKTARWCSERDHSMEPSTSTDMCDLFRGHSCSNCMTCDAPTKDAPSKKPLQWQSGKTNHLLAQNISSGSEALLTNIANNADVLSAYAPDPPSLIPDIVAPIIPKKRKSLSTAPASSSTRGSHWHRSNLIYKSPYYRTHSSSSNATVSSRSNEERYRLRKTFDKMRRHELARNQTHCNEEPPNHKGNKIVIPLASILDQYPSPPSSPEAGPSRSSREEGMHPISYAANRNEVILSPCTPLDNNPEKIRFRLKFEPAYPSSYTLQKLSDTSYSSSDQEYVLHVHDYSTDASKTSYKPSQQRQVTSAGRYPQCQGTSSGKPREHNTEHDVDNKTTYKSRRVYQNENFVASRTSE